MIAVLSRDADETRLPSKEKQTSVIAALCLASTWNGCSWSVAARPGVRLHSRTSPSTLPSTSIVSWGCTAKQLMGWATPCWASTVAVDRGGQVSKNKQNTSSFLLEVKSASKQDGRAHQRWNGEADCKQQCCRKCWRTNMQRSVCPRANNPRTWSRNGESHCVGC